MPESPTSTVVVGNDVVDLLDPRTFGKAHDERFVSRVLDEAGRVALREAEDADLELWCRWSAKEAAYKIFSKLAGAPPPFVHRAYVARWDDEASPAPSAGPTDIRRGAVHHQGHAFPVIVRAHTENGRTVALHALSTSTGSVEAVAHEMASLDQPGSTWTGQLDELKARFTERELEAVGSQRSAAVRLGARAFLARRMGIAEARLEIVCDPGVYGRRPPRVLVDGARGELDVSLSHDGRWIAWAVWTGASAT